jgi:hypothetical protein
MPDFNSRSPLHPLLTEINRAASGGLPFLAIAMTVALPDICVSLISDDGRSTPTLYKDWCRENITADELSYVTADDLYSMRCGILHNGRFGDLKHNVERVMFAIPGPIGITGRMNDAYVYNVADFCKKFTDAVDAWYDRNRENENIKTNIPRLMQYRMKGMPPYVVGIPLLG